MYRYQDDRNAVLPKIWDDGTSTRPPHEVGAR